MHEVSIPSKLDKTSLTVCIHICKYLEEGMGGRVMLSTVAENERTFLLLCAKAGIHFAVVLVNPVTIVAIGHRI